MLRLILCALFCFFCLSPAWAALKTQTLGYSYNGKKFKGYLAYDDVCPGKRPGVLVVHEFWGLNEYAKSRADQLAKLGYVALAADMYGDGQVGQHPDEARALMEAVRNNIEEWVGRAQAALKVLREQPNVDPTRLAAIGYCFGGATVLNLAYSGAPIPAGPMPVEVFGAPSGTPTALPSPGPLTPPAQAVTSPAQISVSKSISFLREIESVPLVMIPAPTLINPIHSIIACFQSEVVVEDFALRPALTKRLSL